MSTYENAIRHYWSMDASQQRRIRRSVLPRCRECGTETADLQACFFCRYQVCAACRQMESWGNKQVEVCASCLADTGDVF